MIFGIVVVMSGVDAFMYLQLVNGIERKNTQWVSAIILHPSLHLPPPVMTMLLCRSYSPCSDNPLVLTANSIVLDFKNLKNMVEEKEACIFCQFSLFLGLCLTQSLRFLFAIEANLIMIILSIELSENEDDIALTCLCSWAWHRPTG